MIVYCHAIISNFQAKDGTGGQGHKGVTTHVVRLKLFRLKAIRKKGNTAHFEVVFGVGILSLHQSASIVLF